MAVAASEDVAVALGRPISAGTETSQVNWWLTGIEMAIKARLGEVTSLDQETVRYVEAEAVAAKLRRAGQTESSITVSVDDGSVTRRYDTRAGAGDITEEWWELLSPNTTDGAFTISPTAGLSSRRGDWTGWR